VSRLDEIPGLAALRARTSGDPRITVAFLDGLLDRHHECFAGADLELRTSGRLLGAGDGGFGAHATHIVSVVLGQPGCGVDGLAPRCRGLAYHGADGELDALSELGLAGLIDEAVAAGANVIHCSFCQPSQSGAAADLLLRSLQRAEEAGVIIVAPSGNNAGNNLCMPACHPTVLATGSIDDERRPAESTNYGDRYHGHGIMAPGTSIIGAKVGGGTVSQKGTSVAAPIMTGIAALLGSLMVQEGRQPDGPAIRRALVAAARPYEGAPDDARRCIGGLVDVGRAMELLGLTGPPVAASPELPLTQHTPTATVDVPGGTEPPVPGPPAVPDGAVPSVRAPSRAYVLGRLDYDFTGETQMLAMAQAMGSTDVAITSDVRAMVAHLDANPTEAMQLCWVLKLRDAPLYVLRPTGPHASGIYELLLSALDATFPGDGRVPVERVSIPGRLTGATQKLYGGRVVPVVEVDFERGIHAWRSDQLEQSVPERSRPALRILLDRFYEELANPGVLGVHRALNAAATNVAQAASAIADALERNLELQDIAAERSRFSRANSECYDVELTFFDPENTDRARRVYRYTIDVADVVPVTVGAVRSWTRAD